ARSAARPRADAPRVAAHPPQGAPARGSGFQLREETFRGPSSLLDLNCNLAQLALLLRTEAAQSNFLQAVCDRSDQQLAAEMRGSTGLVEAVPLPAKFADIELGE